MQYIKQPLYTVFFLFLGFFIYTQLFGPIPFSVHSVQTTKSEFFRVEGKGEATAVPDTAFISLSVTKTTKTVQEGQNQINQTSNAITSDLKNLGIEDKNIKTTNYSVFPTYDYSAGHQNASGYTVSTTIEVRIKPIEKANQAIDKATADGANIVSGPTFIVDEQTQKELEQKARQDAVRSAKEKAGQLSSAAGIRLGKIIDVQEIPGNSIQPLPLAMSDVNTKKEQSTQINPGENKISVTIILSYETL